MNMNWFHICLLIYNCAAFGNSLELRKPNVTIENPKLAEKNATDISEISCSNEFLYEENVRFLDNGDLFIKSYNVTVRINNLHVVKNNHSIYFIAKGELKVKIFNSCSKWIYEAAEFQILENGTVFLKIGDGEILEPGTYGFTPDGKLKMCTVDYCEEDNDDDEPQDDHLTDEERASVLIGQVGGTISILALLAHIAIFCIVPSLRNLPGYNLLSLSVAFLMAYSFLLIGQIRIVVGTFCVVSGILQQYFFLVAFFCMNVMAFDVWKTLKMATERLMVGTATARRRQFLWYSLYAWLTPLAITITTVIMDYTESIPKVIKPGFGKNDKCWMTNNMAKAAFFSFPACTLFLINAVFFILSYLILRQNTMKPTVSQHRQTIQLNFFLYVRLALMMGITWLFGIIGIVSSNNVVWFFFDIFNSLQGLFLFLLFTCSRKVFNHLSDRVKEIHKKSDSATASTKYES